MKISKKLKKVLSVALAAFVLLGAIGLIASIATNDSKNIGSYDFEIGALSASDGQFIENKTAVYTKNAIECQGLEIKPDFDSDVTYQIFWYNEDEVFFGCTEKTSKPYTIFKGPIPELAKYCRIVIFPSQLDEDGRKIKDFKVSIFDVGEIVNNLDITVSKTQDFEPENLFEDLVPIDNKDSNINHLVLAGDRIIINGLTLNDNAVNTSDTSASETESIICVQPDNVAMYKLDLTNSDGDVRCFFFREDGNTVKEYKYSSGNVYYIEVPKLAEGLSFCLVVDDVLYSASLTEYLPKN